MKQLFIVGIFIIGLVSCSVKNIDPSGIYHLDRSGRSYILTIHPDGKYSIDISELGVQNKEIHGQWQDEDGKGKSIFLTGVIWHGTEPYAGNGYWRVEIEGIWSRKICLDGESSICFVKK